MRLQYLEDTSREAEAWKLLRQFGNDNLRIYVTPHLLRWHSNPRKRLKLFDEAVTDQTDPVVRLSRGHLCVDLPECHDQLVQLWQELIKDDSPFVGHGVTDMLLTLGEQRRPDDFKDVVWSGIEDMPPLWDLKADFQYIVGDMTPDQRLKLAGESLVRRSLAHYIIGKVLLSQGRRDEARGAV